MNIEFEKIIIRTKIVIRTDCKSARSDLDIMKEIDRINTKYPSFGVLRIKNELEEVGYQVNHKRIRRLMKKMGIEVIYPKRNLSYNTPQNSDHGLS